MQLSDPEDFIDCLSPNELIAALSALEQIK